MAALKNIREKAMKKILCAILSLASVITMTGVFAASDAAGTNLADQVLSGAIGSYSDSRGELSQADTGMSANKFIYPSPSRSAQAAAANPTSFSFLNVILSDYSGQRNTSGTDLPADENLLGAVRLSFDNARKNGVMLGIRFTFDDRGTQKSEPDWVNLIGIFEAIMQDGVLDDNRDILVFCELGTLGAFGEQWGTRYSDYGYSDELIDLYLQMIPDDVSVLLRTTGRITHWVNSKLGTNYNSANIQNMQSEVSTLYAQSRNSAPNTSGSYISGDGKDFSTGNLISEDLRRLGLYNDGYMGTNWDYGTFSNRANETAYLNSTNTVYGGEFSGDHYLRLYYNGYTTVWWPVNSIPEMYYTHLTYLHGGPWVHSSQSHTFDTESAAQTWVQRLNYIYDNLGCTSYSSSVATETTADGKYKVSYIAPGFDDVNMSEQIETAAENKLGVQLDLSDYYGVNTRKFILDHMGYRYVVRSSRMTAGEVQPGGQVDIDLTIENTGFYRMAKQKKVELLLVNGSSKYSVELDDIDTRLLTTGSHDISKTLTLPENIGGGTWDVYLRMSSYNDDAQESAAYGVKFANAGMYNAEYGANLIGRITVDADEREAHSYTDPRPVGRYYDNPQTYSAVKEYLPLLDSSYTFETSGLYGFTILFRVDGIENDSGIKLTRWDTNGSGGQLHSFNYFFRKPNGDGTYTYGYTITDNGYYLMYNPFWSIGANNGASVAGSTKYDYFRFNATGTAREDKNSPTELNGNAATITPLGIVEGAANSYNVTFHYGQGYNYQGSYSFRNTDRAVAENVQFKSGSRLLDLYTGPSPADYIENGIKYVFAGWTFDAGYRAGLVPDDQIAIGELDLYPYYEPDISVSTINASVVTLNGNKSADGTVYTLDGETHTALIGSGSAWFNNSGFFSQNTDTFVIPAFVISGGEYYRVTGMAERAFASNSDLTALYMPSGVTEVGDDALRGLKNTVKIHTYSDNSASLALSAAGYDIETVSARSEYAAVFKNGEEILYVTGVQSGQTPVYSGSIPQKAADSEHCAYEFTGWSPAIGAITADTEYAATFNGLAHDMGEYVSNGDATCTSDGTKTRTCSRCDYSETVTDEGSILPHSYRSEITVEPGDEPGQITYTCIVCGHTYTEEIPALSRADFNRDGEVNVIDSMLMARYIAQDCKTVGKWDLSGVRCDLMDFDGDGRVGQADLTIINRMISGQ